MPENYRFGGGLTDSLIHPLVLVAMVVAIIVLLVSPRKNAIPAFLYGIFLIPAGQQFVLAGVHLYVHRLIILAGLIRMVRFKETPQVAGKWNSIDKAFSISIVSHAIAFTVLFSNTAAAINQVGFIWDWLGAYIFLRYLIRCTEDIVAAVKYFALLAAIFAVCMLREQLTGQNIFGLLGGVRLICEVRNGWFRSEAVFQHALLAGTFAATLLPLFVLLWKYAQSKVATAIAVLSATVMVITTACSTPLLTYAAAILGILLWPVRNLMRWFRWGLVIGLFALNLVMHAPVWYIIAHVGIVRGSSTSHRADLIDTFLRHIGDWWLLGSGSNDSWGYLMFDTSNQYVEWGVTGGLISLIFFIATISFSFGRIGKARKSVEGNNRQLEWFLWLLGSALFANVVAFFGIGYYDQVRIAWLALLAMISAATIEGSQPNSAKTPVSQDITAFPAPKLAKPMWI
jgi:hypothetical protein